jgi:anti-sigma factor RsiW
MTPRSCAETQSLLAALDDDAPASSRAAIDAHLAACDTCRALAADLTAIRTAAAGLRDLPVPDRVWRSLRPQIVAPVRPAPAWSTAWLAAAAVLLLAVGAALGTLFGGATNGADGAASVAEVAAELDAAEAHYLRAIAGLERIARMDDPALDPGVAQVLRANLQQIDGAIRETRAALAARPDDDIARRGLFDALGGKVALLEQTVALIDAERTLDAAPAGAHN